MCFGRTMTLLKSLDKALMSVPNTGESLRRYVHVLVFLDSFTVISDVSLICPQILLSSHTGKLQNRSVIFVQNEEEQKLATTSKQKEQLKLLYSEVMTEIQTLDVFYPAEYEHQV